MIRMTMVSIPCPKCGTGLTLDQQTCWSCGTEIFFTGLEGSFGAFQPKEFWKAGDTLVSLVDRNGSTIAADFPSLFAQGGYSDEGFQVQIDKILNTKMTSLSGGVIFVTVGASQYAYAYGDASTAKSLLQLAADMYKTIRYLQFVAS